MARLSNKEIWDMSLNEAAAYTDAHPAEAWRFAKAQGRSALEQSKKAAKKWFQKQKLYLLPPKRVKFLIDTATLLSSWVG